MCGCGCLFLMFAIAGPRLGILFLWVFTDLVNQAFNTFVLPLIGAIFLPYSTLVYVLVYNPVTGMSAWDWFFVVIAFFIDLGAYGSATQKDKLGY